MPFSECPTFIGWYGGVSLKRSFTLYLEGDCVQSTLVSVGCTVGKQLLTLLACVLTLMTFNFVVQPKSGLLQASIVTAYCTYITWSAVSTEPYGSGEFYCRSSLSSFDSYVSEYRVFNGFFPLTAMYEYWVFNSFFFN